MSAGTGWRARSAFAAGADARPRVKAVMDRLLKFMWSYPFAPLRILADVEVTRAHFLDVYEGRAVGRLPKAFLERRDDHVWRRKDLEVCRVLGAVPGTVMPAYHVYNVLFDRQPTLDGICRTGSPWSRDWPQCPHARRGYYAKIAGEPRANLHRQHELGEELAGHGLWAMVRPRSREDMRPRQGTLRSVHPPRSQAALHPAQSLPVHPVQHRPGPRATTAGGGQPGGVVPTHDARNPISPSP